LPTDASAQQGLTDIVLAVLIVIAVGAGIVLVSAAAFSRRRHFSEVDRFHRASRMTSEWARSGVTRPVFHDPDAVRDGAQGEPQSNGDRR
jgi:type II secretory pathway pseudopilin PulG